MLNVKNAIAATLIFVGLIFSIIGWSKKSGDTIETEIKGQELVVRNSDSQHFNWRAFMGLTLCVVAVGFFILPGPEKLEAERYGH